MNEKRPGKLAIKLKDERPVKIKYKHEISIDLESILDDAIKKCGPLHILRLVFKKSLIEEYSECF